MPPSIRPFVPIALYEGVLDALPAGLAVYRLDDLDDPGSLRLLYVNGAAGGMMGYDPQADLGKTLREALPGLLDTELPAVYAEVARTGKGRDLGDIPYDGDGKGRPGIYALRLFGLPDQSVGLLFQNVTEERAAEVRRLHEVAGLADAALEGIVLTEHGRVLLANGAFADLIGYTREELAGMEVLDLVPEGEPRERVRERIASERTEPYEAVLRRKDGSTFPVDVRGRHIEFEGRIVRATAVRDATERMRALDAVREQARRFRAIFDSQFQFIGLMEPDGTLVEANRTALDFGGVGADEVIGKKIWDSPWWRISKEERRRVREAVARAAAGETVRYVTDVQGAGDTIATIDFSIKPFTDEAGRVVLLIPEGRDITADVRTQTELRDLKATQAALAREEARYRSLVEASSALVWTTTPAGAFDGDQPGWRAFTGQTAEEAAGPGWLRAVHPDDRKKTEAAWRRAVQTGTPYEVEHRVCRHDGTYRWMLARAVPLRDEAGAVVEWVGLHADVTERREAEEAVHRALAHAEEAERQLTTLVDNLPELAWSARPDGAIDFYNHRWYAYTGTTPDEMLGWGWEKVHHPDHLPEVKERWRASIESGEPFEMAFPLRGADGAFRWFLTRVSPLLDSDGNVVRWIGTNADIDEQRRLLVERDEAAARLAESEAQHRMLAETAADAIITVGADSIIRYANPAVEAVFGYTADELLGSDLTRLMPEGLRGLHTAGMARYLETGVKRLHWGHVEVPGLRKDGRQIPLAVSFGDYERGGERHFTGFLRDVSAERDAREALRESEAQFRLLTDAMPQLIWTSTAEGVPDYYNEQWFAYTGMPRKGALPTNWGDYLHPDDRDAAFAEFARAAETTTPFEKAYRFRRHDGTYRWFLGRALPVRGEDGRVARWFGSATDIHDFREAQEALRESEARFRAMADAAPVLIWVAGPDRGATWLNQEWLAFTGRALEDQLGDGWAEGVHPDDAERFRGAYAASFDRREPFEGEFRLRRHDGAYRWLLVRGTPRTTPEGEFLGFIGSGIDIHEMRETARALEERVAARTAEARAAAGRLDAVINGTVDLIAAVDHDVRILAINEPYQAVFEAVFGTRPAVGMTADEALPEGVPPEELERSKATWRRALAGETFSEVRESTYEPLGFKAFEYRYSPLRDASGEIFGAVHVGRDVTESVLARQAAEAFAGHLRRLHAVTTAEHATPEALLEDYIRAGCAILDLPHGAIVEVAPGAGTYRTRAVITPEGVEVPRHGPFEGTLSASALAKGRTVATADASADPAQGSVSAAVGGGAGGYIGTPLYVEDDVVGVLSFASAAPRSRPFAPHEVEIVEILAELVGHTLTVERAQRAEREAELRYRTVVEAMDEGIVVHDAAGAIVTWNDAAERVLGLTGDQLAGRTPADAGWRTVREDEAPFPGEEHPASVALRTGEPQRGVLMGVYTPGGELHWISVNAAPLPDPEDPAAAPVGVVVSFADVTLIKRAEATLRRYTDELEDRNAELEQFAYVASHDLQEPLRTVASFLQLLERRYAEELDDRAREYIAFAVDGARRMQALIQGLLAYSRVGTRGRSFEPVDAAAVAEDVLVDLGPAAAEAGAEVEVGPLPTVCADPTQLHQLLLNLVANAIKFSAPGRPPRVAVAAAKGRERGRPVWRFTVADNGIGLDPKYADRVFQLFQRLHTRDEYPGTGIGLALCKKIAERHGGALTYSPNAEGGTTFTFTLPVRSPGCDAEGPAAEPA